MKARLLALVLVAAAGFLPGCRKLGTQELDAVRALKARARPGFQPPADGLLTDAQIDQFLKVRQASGRRPMSDTAAELGADPVELAWVRARITEALLALDARQVAESSSEAYAAALARLRETRRSTRDTKAAARIDAEIAALEKERAGLKRGDTASPAARNAGRVGPRRAELERVGP